MQDIVEAIHARLHERRYGCVSATGVMSLSRRRVSAGAANFPRAGAPVLDGGRCRSRELSAKRVPVATRAANQSISSGFALRGGGNARSIVVEVRVGQRELRRAAGCRGRARDAPPSESRSRRRRAAPRRAAPARASRRAPPRRPRSQDEPSSRPCSMGEYAMTGTPRSRHHGSRSNSMPRRLEVVEHLVGRQRAAAGQRDQFAHVGRVEIAHAPVRGSCRRADQRLERVEGLRERHGCRASAAGRGRCGRCRRRFRLRSHAATVPRREALCGSTLLTRNTSSRRPAIASPTTDSARAVGVHLRGVDQRHAEVEPEAQRRDLVGAPRARPRPCTRCPVRARARTRRRGSATVAIGFMPPVYAAPHDTNRLPTRGRGRYALASARAPHAGTRTEQAENGNHREETPCLRVIATQTLLNVKPKPSEVDIKYTLDGHLCRRGSRNRIVKAVRRAPGEIA